MMNFTARFPCALVLLLGILQGLAPAHAGPPAADGQVCVDVRIGTESTGYLDCINAELRDVVSRQDGRQQAQQMAVQESAPLAPSQTAVFNQAATNERIVAFRHGPAPPPPPVRPGLPGH
ncbi:MAG: hypothetical protein JWR07_1506 [Nevskia sp.]|nr:hypothetical protein [Nevskia sp.]